MRMFEVVAEEFQGGWNSQKNWHTVANELRAKQRQMQQQQYYSLQTFSDVDTCPGGGGFYQS